MDAKVYKALTIAGSDTSGGAGIQADLKAFQSRHVYGLTVLTTIVAQDPDRDWFHAVYPLPTDTVRAQLNTVLSGIGVDAVKTGMLPTSDIIELVADTIDRYNLDRVVVDPVMVCKGADEPVNPDAAASLREVLVPKATVVTPNLFEAAQLSQRPAIKSIDDMKEAATIIHELGPRYVVIKGGKLDNNMAVDVLYDGRSFEMLEWERVDTAYTHGAGCTFAAMITAELAKGISVQEAVQQAKKFITQAIRQGFKLNQYVGSVNHLALNSFNA
ncbi:phosphomethylpyrimidine kinase [Caldalkalibacillus thermarum TA2.A1]|uniref:pyridoxal kinase n=1 Tax=Caldalkalibacillus thermarum (strain TA2.A1) TaxID=986075 RepID=F5L8L8_CALTT|nr:pyridoxine/pyridoxal/pyridoxamine kinase [Caldalkalibacillus thermarum]EGL82357.1 phosphomethylpyrimidine kinase [Caldalkalibacillus thermarum TA2.A1]QZT32918.1 pyridoxine/pyridoxal/pyridoxamine kinase [Caldalkalibacillus thermarum TA2.A1]